MKVEHLPQEWASSLDGMPHVIQSTFALRRKREKLFGPDLFSDPAWELLLLLFGAGEAGIAFDQLASEVNASPRVCDRWLAILSGRGFVERIEEDPRTFRLSRQGIERISQLWAVY